MNCQCMPFSRVKPFDIFFSEDQDVYFDYYQELPKMVKNRYVLLGVSLQNAKGKSLVDTL